MSVGGLDDRKLEELITRVVERLAPSPSLGQTIPNAAPAEPCAPAPPIYRSHRSSGQGNRGLFDDVDHAVAAARVAHETLVHSMSLEKRNEIIAAMRQCTLSKLSELSQMAVSETGLGRYDDKINKNRLCAVDTPGTEILTPWCQTGDDGLVLMERAPFGVICAITPCTNATETIICNAIGMLAAGNSVVFNVHPAAKGVCGTFVQWLNEAIVSVGGPENLICMIREPTIESANNLMTHKGIRLVVVTGGPGVVKAAMNSGKRAICGGPGNPPVVVDETADIRRAGRDIVLGCSLDNNIVCIAEKEIFAVRDIADLLKKEMCAQGAVAMSRQEISRLENLVVHDGHAVKDWVGKDAAKIAKAIGKNVPESTRVLLCEVDSEDHPFVQAELLMPVLPMVRVSSVEEGIAAAVRAEHGFGHTAAMHSTNINSLHQMARAMDCSIFVKNAPTYAGLGFTGEGYTSFTIASPTGEGLTTAISFSRERRCTLKDHFRIT